MVPTVARCVDLVVQIGVEPDGARRIREIVALPGRVEGGVVETADIFVTHEVVWSGRRAIRRMRTASPGTGSTWPNCWPAGPRMPVVSAAWTRPA